MTYTYTTRYVVTHIGAHGMRTLAQGCQGRYTYAMPQEAQAQIDAMHANNSPERLSEFYGLPLEVRPCECWPNHFDPVGIYFDTESLAQRATL